MMTTIAAIEGANTIDEIKEIAVSLEIVPEFIGNMQQLHDSMSKPELALFYHQCLGSPAITTLLTALPLSRFWREFEARLRRNLF